MEIGLGWTIAAMQGANPCPPYKYVRTKGVINVNRATSSYERCQPTIEFFWWCPECGIELEPYEVAEDGTHDMYEGGCGERADYCFRRKKKKSIAL